MTGLRARHVPLEETDHSTTATGAIPTPVGTRCGDASFSIVKWSRRLRISEDNPPGTRLISDGPFSLSPPVVTLPSSAHPIVRRAQYVPHRTLRFPSHTSHHLGACLVPTFLATDLIGRYCRNPGYTWSPDKDLAFCAESACFEIRPVWPCGPTARRTLARIQRRRVVVRPFPRCLAGYPCLLQGGLVGVYQPAGQHADP